MTLSRWLPFFLFVCLTLQLSSCASNRATPYANIEKGYGKSVHTVRDRYSMSLFSGNPKTSPKSAYHFSRLSAIEHCRDRNEWAFLLKTRDSTEKESYTEVTSYPTIMPGYSRFYGRMYRDPYTVMYNNTYSYPVTLTYPNFSTLFTCVARVTQFSNDPDFEDLSKELVSPFTQDFRGGLFVKKVVGAGALKEGDVLLAIEGKRLESLSELYEFYFDPKLPLRVNVRLIRDRKIHTMPADLIDVTEATRKMNLVEIGEACKFFRNKDTQPPICSSSVTSER